MSHVPLPRILPERSFIKLWNNQCSIQYACNRHHITNLPQIKVVSQMWDVTFSLLIRETGKSASANILLKLSKEDQINNPERQVSTQIGTENQSIEIKED